MLGLAGSPDLKAGSPMEDLLAAYRSAPRDYPTGKDGRGIPFAEPDRSAWFRWHFFREDAIHPFSDVQMDLCADPYNPMEDGGVSVPNGNSVTWEFTGEHPFGTGRALKVTWGGKGQGPAQIHIHSIAGPVLQPKTGLRASAWWSNYRWLRFEAFHSGRDPLPVRICGVPMVLPPGPSTVAVKTADAGGHDFWSALARFVVLEFPDPPPDTIVYLDRFRMEQEVPRIIRDKGMLLQFAGRFATETEPVRWPGFTCVATDDLFEAGRAFGWCATPSRRRQALHVGDRNAQNGLLLGWCSNPDAPFAVRLPNGRYGVAVLAAPARSARANFDWTRGLAVRVNGVEKLLLAPCNKEEVKREALSGEDWDYRPGACLWEELVRRPFYPELRIVFTEVRNGCLRIEFPETMALQALIVFPESEREVAERELGRLNFLLAESWDVAHPRVRPAYAERARYVGLHEEFAAPHRIPHRLNNLDLGPGDWERGLVLFHRGLTESVYPDTIPSPRERAFGELSQLAVPGQTVCFQFGILPLRLLQDVRLRMGSFASPEGGTITEAYLDLRVSRYHQKTTSMGHSNTDYNYQEHYLIARPALNLFPASARRVYLDVTVPAKVSPGVYRGSLAVQFADGTPLAEVPMILEVVPIALEDPPLHFAASLAHPRLTAYGMNTFVTSYDDALRHGYKGYLACLSQVPPPTFQGRRVGWDCLIGEKELLAPLLSAGRSGEGPRGFFGGTPAGRRKDPGGGEEAAATYALFRHELPEADILNVTMPVYCAPGYEGQVQHPHEWRVFQTPASDWKYVVPRGTVEALGAARNSGRGFWFVDGLHQSKEQAARFSFGIWLWKLGASGRFTVLSSSAVRLGMRGTAAETFEWLPYYSLVGFCQSNTDAALMPSIHAERLNPARDLILLRAGIDDYRYVHTLATRIRQAEAACPLSPAVFAARDFLDGLSRELSLDLSSYYDCRGGIYSENWYPLPGNPWQDEKFEATRRACAAHILALQQELGKR